MKNYKFKVKQIITKDVEIMAENKKEAYQFLAELMNYEDGIFEEFEEDELDYDIIPEEYFDRKDEKNTDIISENFMKKLAENIIETLISYIENMDDENNYFEEDKNDIIPDEFEDKIDGILRKNYDEKNDYNNSNFNKIHKFFDENIANNCDILITETDEDECKIDYENDKNCKKNSKKNDNSNKKIEIEFINKEVKNDIKNNDKSSNENEEKCLKIVCNKCGNSIKL